MKKVKKTHREILKEGLINSRTFAVVIDKHFLKDIKDPNSDTYFQDKIAKELFKPTILIIDDKLSKDEILEVESYYTAHNVIKEIITDIHDLATLELVAKSVEQAIDSVKKR